MTPVLLVARPATGGIRTHVTELIARLPRSKWSVSLAAPADLLDSLISDLPTYEPIPCPVSAKPGPRDIEAARIIRRAARPAGTIVHAHGIRAGFVAALANRGHRFPLVVTFHNIPPKSALAKAVVKFIVSRSATTIAVSKAIASMIPGNVQVVPNGIDLAAYDTVDREAARAEFGLAEGSIAVVCASRLSREKGIDSLVAAAAHLPDVTFLVAGDGPERDNLAAQVGPNVRLLGRIESVSRLLAAGDIACVPSLTEGQGIFALEAMAAGLPVVASNVGGLPEMVVDGVTGILVDPGSPLMIAEALKSLAASPDQRSKLGATARASAMQTGDIAAMIERIEAIYASVV